MADQGVRLREFPTTVPRHAFNARGFARAADVWRAFQEVAIEASAQAGWPPARYLKTETAFIMRAMTVRHHHQLCYGEPLQARTWIRQMRRGGMLCTRQVELHSERGLLCEATQEWVHVTARLKPARAQDELLSAFPVLDEGVDVELPRHQEMDGTELQMDVNVWHSWMDPLDHVNHPAYVDWADETVFRKVDAHGVSPHALTPSYDYARYHAGVHAGQTAKVRTRAVGVAPDGLALSHSIFVNGKKCAELTTVRNTEDLEALVQLFEA